MFTSAEARLGRNMSLVAAIGIILTIAINVATGGASGAANSYDPTWGPVDNLINFAQDVALVFVVVLAMKLFVADDKPVFRVMSYMMIAINTMWAVRDLAPTAIAQSVWDQGVTPTQVEDMLGTFTFGSFLLLSIWVWTTINADGGELIPRWGILAGKGASILFIVLQSVSFFGQSLGITPTVIAPIFLLGGVILWPISLLGLSRAFATKI